MKTDIESVSVERNGVTLDFPVVTKTKGKNKGDKYLGFDDKDKSKLAKWLGEDLWKKLVPKLNSLAQGWTGEATQEDAEGKLISFDEEKFSSFASQLAARGEDIATLRADLEELMAQLGDLDPDKVEDQADILSLMKEIRSLNQDIKDKKRVRKPKDEVANGQVAVAAQ